MRKFLNMQVLTTVAFATVVACFFALFYPHHLHFQEQYQIFLYQWSYVSDIISLPGGVADYLGRFCVQFFLYSWAGALIVAFLIVAVQLLCSRLLGNSGLYMLSFIPAVLLCFFIFDENAKLGAIWAVVLSLLVVCCIGIIQDKILRLITVVLLLVPMYWTAGPVSVLFLLLSLIMPNIRGWSTILLSATLVVLAVGIIPAAWHHFSSFPFERFYTGIHYHADHQEVCTLLWLTVLVIALLPVADFFGQKFKVMQQKKVVITISTSMLIIITAVLFNTLYDPHKEEVLAYDNMARFQQWTEIIETAKKKAPTDPLQLTALNLALGQKTGMSEHMFEYAQIGMEGLLPAFELNAVSPLTTAEAYYQLGMVQTAQRFVFEAQEAIPDLQKSSRCYQRLAETNLILGNYEVARKYLEALKHTLFYREWAAERLPLLDDDESIDNHPEYGRLRYFLTDDDYFFSSGNLPKMVGRQLLANHRNRLAFEYLQASYLLTGNLDSFLQCMEFGESLGYKTLPKHFQEALILWWSHSNDLSHGGPEQINPAYVLGLQQFYTASGQQGMTPERLARQFGHTYWYYFFTKLYSQPS